MKEAFGLSDSVDYLSFDHLWFTNHSALDLVDTLQKSGVTHLFIDEVHHLEHWATILKNIYDFYPDLHVAYSGSWKLELATRFLSGFSGFCIGEGKMRALAFQGALRQAQGSLRPQHRRLRKWLLAHAVGVLGSAVAALPANVFSIWIILIALIHRPVRVDSGVKKAQKRKINPNGLTAEDRNGTLAV